MGDVQAHNVTVDITQLVRDIQARGPQQNYGLMLQLKTDVAYRAMTFWSFYAEDPRLRPQIIIET